MTNALQLHRSAPGLYLTRCGTFELRRHGDANAWTVSKIRRLAFQTGAVKYPVKTFTGATAFQDAKVLLAALTGTSARREAARWFGPLDATVAMGAK